VCRGLGIRSILAVPVRRGDAVGILAVFSGWAGTFSERDVRTLSSLVELVAAQLPQHARAIAGIVETQASQLESGTPRAPYAIGFTDQRDAVLSSAILEVREEAPARHGWRSLKSLVLALAVLAVTSEVLVWRGLHLKEVFRMVEAPLVARMPGSVPRPIPAISKPAAEMPRRPTILKTIPGMRAAPTPTLDRTRSSKNANSEKGPTVLTKPLPDEHQQAAAIPNPTSGLIEGPLNLRSPVAESEEVVQPEPVSREARTTLPPRETGDKIQENDQPMPHKSQTESEHILAFRGELRDRMHMSRVQGVVAIRFAI